MSLEINAIEIGSSMTKLNASSKTEGKPRLSDQEILKRRKNTEAVRRCREKQRGKLKATDGFLKRALAENIKLKDAIRDLTNCTLLSMQMISGDVLVDYHSLQRNIELTEQAEKIGCYDDIEKDYAHYNAKIKIAENTVNRVIRHPVGKHFIEKTFKPA
eukprot:Nk52_evm64s223 gene=Nk52_evmTU64s223